VSFVKPTVSSGSRVFIQNLFCNFGHSYKFLRILEICTILWELNQLENNLNRPHSGGPNLAHDYSARRGALPCAAGRPAGWATDWRPGPSVEAARDAGAGRASDTLTAWSRRGGHARAAGRRGCPACSGG
jgi:hypothetical protein